MSEPQSNDNEPRTSWSFRIFVALAALYLGWRAVQGVQALIRWIGGG